MWNYEAADDLINDLIPNGKYSDSTGVANAINELPEDAVVFEISDDYCNAVLPYLTGNHKVYNPYTKSEATYADRAPNSKVFLKYNEFIEIAKEMFPNAKSIYVILALESGRIEGIYDKNEDDGVTVYYSAQSDERVIKEQFKVIEINMNLY